MKYSTALLAHINMRIYELNKKKEAITDELEELEDMRKELEFRIASSDDFKGAI